MLQKSALLTKWEKSYSVRLIRNLSKNAWVSLPAINLLVGLFSVVTSSLVARSLGPSARGILAASVLWTLWVISVGAFVQTQSITYVWAKSNDRDRTWSASILLTVILSLLLVPAALLLNYLLIPKGDSALAAANLSTLLIPVTMLGACVTSIFLAEGAFGRFGATRLMTSVVYTTGVVVVVGMGWANVINLAWLNAVSPIAAILLAAYWLIQDRRLHWRWTNWSQVKQITKYGISTNLSGLPYNLNLRLDQAAMALWMPPEVLGFYAVAVAWSSTQSFIGNGVSMILLSKSSNVEKSDTSSVQRVITQFRIASAIILLLGLAATVVTPWGINLLFGAAFAPAILPAMILSVAVSVANIKLLLLETSRGLGEPAIGIGAESLGLLVTVVLLVLLLPTWGAVGAAVTSLFSYCTSTFALAVLTSRRTRLPVRSFLALNRADLQEVSVMVERIKSRTM